MLVYSNVARLTLHVTKAERRSAEHINIQDGGPQEHLYKVSHENALDSNDLASK